MKPDELAVDRLSEAFERVWSDQRPRRRDALAKVRGEILHLALEAQAEAPRRRWPWVAGGLALALALVVAIVGLGWSRYGRALAFTVDGARAGVGDFVAAGERGAVLDFSDGSQVRLHPGATGRVTTTDPKGARVLLESGDALVNVVHRSETAWVVDAGPYRIDVVGTAFDVAWDPDRRHFALRLDQGKVRVEGPLLEGGHELVAGQALEVSLRDSTVRRRSDEGEVVIVAEPDPPSGVEPPIPEAARPRVRARPRRPQGTEPAPVDWRAAAERDAYEEAYAAAKPQFDRLVRTLDAADLQRLGDVARFAGEIEAAETALQGFRRRFPRHRERATVAFTLGRLADEQRKDPAAAMKWFAEAVAERPDGRLHREAMGRHMDAASRAGQAAVARRVAAEYLARYPRGPHAEQARRLLEREAG